MAKVTRETKRRIEATFRRDPKTPLTELAEKFGVHRMTVRSTLEEAGLWSRRAPGRPGRVDPEAARAAELYRTGLPLPEVAARLTVHPQKVVDMLRKLGVPLRS